jgi:hypothetical protein
MSDLSETMTMSNDKLREKIQYLADMLHTSAEETADLVIAQVLAQQRAMANLNKFPDAEPCSLLLGIGGKESSFDKLAPYEKVVRVTITLSTSEADSLRVVLDAHDRSGVFQIDVSGAFHFHKDDPKFSPR